MENRLVVDDGVALWYRVVGDGSEPVVVPGAVTDADLEALVAPGRQVVFVDSRNRGRSEGIRDAGRLGFFREVRDLEGVREHFRFESMALLGWSYLAGVVATYALAQPARVTRLVLVAPIGPMSEASVDPVPDPAPDALARLDQLRAAGLAEREPIAYCEEWRRVFVAPQLSDPAAFGEIRSRPCDHPNEWPSNVTRALAHVFVDLGLYDWRADLARLSIPVLVVHGETDSVPREVAEEWVVACPNARLLSLSGAGRYPWVEDPGAFFGAVGTFLDGTWPAGARR